MSTVPKRWLFMLASVMMLVSICAMANGEEGGFSTSPSTHQGKKWRIAYYEGGPYIEYQKGLLETIRGLMKLGWIEKAELPTQSGEETVPLWNWLNTTARSDYLEFLKDGHYSSAWDEAIRNNTVQKILKRLNDTKDVDLIIAMGTWAGEDIANDKQDTPTLVFFASDPIAAGIIKTIDDSGLAHVHAAIDPTVYERQIRIFHEMIRFKKLGMAYENSVDGRSYAAVDVVEKVAKELGFEIVSCHTISDIGDVKSEAESVKKCFHQLAPSVDAIYVTQQGGIRTEHIPDLVEIANKYHTATFSQAGSDEVKHGFLASLSQANFTYVGEFNAKTISKVLNGARPNQLTQRFEPPPKIALNLKTAEIISFDPPIILVGAADEIFREIAPPNR